MQLPHSWRGLSIALAIAAGSANAGSAQETKPDDSLNLNDLALEVNALRTLHSLGLNDEQLKTLRSMAKETAQKPGKRTSATASKDYRDKLQALRAALLEQDDERINQLNEDLDDLRDTENPTIDDGVEITPPARKAAPTALKVLKVRQVKDYLEILGDDLGDPVSELVSALETVRGLTGKEWRDRREELVERTVRLATGIDVGKAEKLTDKLMALLSTAHGLSDADFKAQRAKLEETAREAIGDLDSFQVIRNALEYSLADLLSNPQLAAALDARLKDSK